MDKREGDWNGLQLCFSKFIFIVCEVWYNAWKTLTVLDWNTQGKWKTQFMHFFSGGRGWRGGSEHKSSANGEFKMFDLTMLISFSSVTTTAMRNWKKYNLCQCLKSSFIIIKKTTIKRGNDPGHDQFTLLFVLTKFYVKQCVVMCYKITCPDFTSWLKSISTAA